MWQDHELDALNSTLLELLERQHEIATALQLTQKWKAFFSSTILNDQQRLVRMRAYLKEERALLDSFTQTGKMPNGTLFDFSFEDVPRISIHDLSFQRFFTEFALARRPVVIEGLDVGIDVAAAWSDINNSCGAMILNVLHRLKDDHASWARLEKLEIQDLTLTQFMHMVEENQLLNSTMVFDSPLQPNKRDSSKMFGCRALLDRLIVPRYFTMDIFKRLPKRFDGKHIRIPDPFSGHPSIFVQPAGSRSGWHVDTLASHFWQVLLVGRKRWHLAPFRTERHRWLWLCNRPRYSYVVPSGDNESLNKPREIWLIDDIPSNLSNACPLWRLAANLNKAYIEVETEPGDVLFVPAGTPHQVDNLHNSLAISMNYVDASNEQAFLAAADATEPHRVARWRYALQKISPPTLQSPNDLPFWQYASGPRPWEQNWM